MGTIHACPNCRKIHGDTAESTACYADFNRKLRAKYDSVPPELEAIAGAYSVRCSVCGAKGPTGATIYSGVRLAQQEGFTHDSERMRAGQPLTWFCSDCGKRR